MIVSSGFAVCQDDDRQPAAGMSAKAEALAARIFNRGGPRVALSTGRVDLVAAALMACARANRELLLLRSHYPLETDLWDAWEVSGVIGEDLSVVPRQGPWQNTSGFAVLLTTSGTTGTPKIARHGIEQLTGRIRRPRSASEAMRWLLTYHPASFAGMQVLLTAMLWGCELVAVAEPSIPALSQAALQYRPTHISGTPTFWRLFLSALGKDSARVPLSHATFGGEAVDQATLDRLRIGFPEAAVAQIYASTEAGALFAVRDGRAGFPVEWLEEGVDGVRLRIRDDILQVQSPRAMRGYLAGGPASPLDDAGWLVTGDMVAIRDGRVEFLGRADGLINVGGAKVLPEEVESVLLLVPGVTDARVSGAKNPITGALITAEIALAPDANEEAVRAAILGRASSALEPHKVPRIIRFVDRISYGVTGKKQRRG